jgi:hypothetical protein
VRLPLFVYVLTSRSDDDYAEMVLVSVLSLKMTNSEAKSLILCDDKTEKSLRERRHQLLRFVDTIRVAHTPEGSPTFQNRWIKTQLGLMIDEPFVYIDGDTFVRGRLDFSSVSTPFAAVANHNAARLLDQIWGEDREHLIHMGWPLDFSCYFNGGLFHVRPNSASREFFSTWHRLWLEGGRKTQRLRDQPSLNTALVCSKCPTTELPFQYNQQLLKCEAAAAHGLIWHFYSSELIDTTVLGTLVKIAKEQPRRLKAAVLRAIGRDELWPNLDVISQILLRSGSSRGPMSTAKRFWLMNERRSALKAFARYLQTKIRHCLIDTSGN